MLTSETFKNCLEHIFPCTGLIYVGAGNGSALNSERFSRISKLLAIEADDLAFSYLANNLQNRTGWTALKALVGENEAETIFFTASNPNESGLLNPEVLKPIWRNLTCLSSRPKISTTLSSVLNNQYQTNYYNWLCIDCLPSARILHGLEKHLEQFDVIDVRILDHSAGILEDGCTKAECDTLLTPLGYRMAFIEEATNPMVQSILYVRDARATLKVYAERLTQRYQFEIEQITQGKAIAEKNAAERVLQAEQANKAKEVQAKLAQVRQAQIEQLIQAKAAAEQLAVERTQLNLEQLQTQLSNILEEKLLKQVAINNDHLKEVETRLRTDNKRGLANAVKQIESFISIQNYLSTGESISDFHGWPISPDIGLFLLEIIRDRQYDLIIEFGSGTSTIMFAKALKINAKCKLDILQSAVKKQIVSFEHDSNYHKKTLDMLKTHNLDEQVDVLHAQLIDWSEGGDNYLYYNCEDALVDLAQQLKDQVRKILVLVDGPPSVTCANARYPAVPIIFNKLGKHQIDVILDDANRPEEKAVIEMWRLFWKKRSIHITEKNIASEKGIYHASNF